MRNNKDAEGEEEEFDIPQTLKDAMGKCLGICEKVHETEQEFDVVEEPWKDVKG